jgi:hypothetical protein
MSKEFDAWFLKTDTIDGNVEQAFLAGQKSILDRSCLNCRYFEPQVTFSECRKGVDIAVIWNGFSCDDFCCNRWERKE